MNNLGDLVRDSVFLGLGIPGCMNAAELDCSENLEDTLTALPSGVSSWLTWGLLCSVGLRLAMILLLLAPKYLDCRDVPPRWDGLSSISQLTHFEGNGSQMSWFLFRSRCEESSSVAHRNQAVHSISMAGML